MAKKYTIEDMRVLALKNNGKCLSEKYINCDTNLEWQCECGNIFPMRPYCVKIGQWCPKCKGGVRHNLDVLKNKAQQYGGECLSTEYINSSTKYLWQCSNGHQFKTTWSNVQNQQSWCPQCYNYIGEQLSRFIFESLTDYKFNKTRKLIKSFEIDGYCERLKLAFEYNGEQHYKEISHWNNSLKEQQKRDRKIRYELNKRGIKLIVIHYKYYKTKESLEKHIRNKLKKLDLIKNNIINWNSFEIGENKIEDLNTILKQHNMIVNSNIYLGANKDIEIKCLKCEHIQITKPTYIKNYKEIKCEYCNSFGVEFPEIIKDWNYDKNNITPYAILSGARRNIWWKCHKCGCEKLSTTTNRKIRGCENCKHIQRLKKSTKVYFDKRRNIYEYKLQINNKNISLGRYKKESDAKKIRKLAVELYEQGERDPEAYKKLREEFKEKFNT